MDLVALSNGLHGSVQMDSVALFSWIGWLRHRGILRINIATGSVWENLFIYYFVGMILSRVGSILIERILRSLKVKNKKTGTKDPYLKFAEYGDYIDACNKDPLISTLNEVNNTYRTLIATMFAIICAKLYDSFLLEWMNRIGVVADTIVFAIICLLTIWLLIYSYKKQTDYIRARVQKCVDCKKNKSVLIVRKIKEMKNNELN